MKLSPLFAVLLFVTVNGARAEGPKVPCLEVSSGRCVAVPRGQCGVSPNYRLSDDCSSSIVSCFVRSVDHPKGKCIAMRMSECLTQHGDLEQSLCRASSAEGVAGGCSTWEWLVCNFLPGAGSSYAEEMCNGCLHEAEVGETKVNAPEPTPLPTVKAAEGAPSSRAAASQETAPTETPAEPVAEPPSRALENWNDRRN